MFPSYIATRLLALAIHSFHTSSIIPMMRSSVPYLTHPILYTHFSHISSHFHTHDPLPPFRRMILSITTQNNFSLYTHCYAPSSHSLHSPSYTSLLYPTPVSSLTPISNNLSPYLADYFIYSKALL